VIQSTKHYQPDLLDQNFSNDNQNYSIFNEEINTPNQQQSFKFKRINDYIENHYHDSNSEDVDMDENGGKIKKNVKLYEILIPNKESITFRLQ